VRTKTAGPGPAVLIMFTLTASVLSFGCGGEQPDPAQGVESRFVLRSSAFGDGEPIPLRHTCDGEDISPAMEWDNLPPGTSSLVLMMDDPDAVPVAGKVWDHWILYNIPVRAVALAEGIPPDVDLPGGAHNGRGSARVGYQGPCPPPGQVHTYVFRGYAVDTFIDLPGGATKPQVLTAIEGHVLAVAEMTGTYGRQ
jgi:Raf kinase inhibitor-like YbhB/YbcL family protein